MGESWSLNNSVLAFSDIKTETLDGEKKIQKYKIL